MIQEAQSRLPCLMPRFDNQSYDAHHPLPITLSARLPQKLTDNGQEPSLSKHAMEMDLVKGEGRTSMQTLSILCASSKTMMHSFSSSLDTICDTFATANHTDILT